jgi:hypothetical protein
MSTRNLTTKMLLSFNPLDLSDLTTKSQLSNLLGISRTTLYEFHQIAASNYSFLSDYPSSDFSDDAYTKHPMTKYQCWFIWMLYVISRKVPRNKLYTTVGNSILLNYELSNLLNKECFQQFQQENTIN